MSDLTWRRWSPRDRYSSHTENMKLEREKESEALC